MSMRKYGTGSDQVIVPEDGDLAKTASSTPQEHEEVLAEVQAEALDADHEE